MSEQPNLLPDLPPEKRVPERMHLVTVGTRSISIAGWSTVAALEHLELHRTKPANHQWCEIGCMARTMFHLNSKANRQKVRRQIANTFSYALTRRVFIVVEYATGRGTHGEATALKLYGESLGLERQHAEVQLARMLRRREINQSKYERARQLLQGDLFQGDMA